MKWIFIVFSLLTSPAWAVEPSEILDDPILEERARNLSSGLRCPICQNESIDESHADLSRELRLILRERLVAGDTDAQIMDYLVARYGEFILLKPTASDASFCFRAMRRALQCCKALKRRDPRWNTRQSAMRCAMALL